MKVVTVKCCPRNSLDVVGQPTQSEEYSSDSDFDVSTITVTRNTCMRQPFAFISKHCFNMKYSERTQAHFARVM